MFFSISQKFVGIDNCSTPTFAFLSALVNLRLVFYIEKQLSNTDIQDFVLNATDVT